MKLFDLKSALVALALAVLWMPMAAADDNDDDDDGGRAARESVEVSDLFVFGTTDKVNGAVILVRDFRNRVINATVTTAAAVPDAAYSMWWAVFNFPQFCIQPYQCSGADIGSPDRDPRVKPSVFWAGGFVADSYGNANTALQLVPGRTSRELFGGTQNFGLMNLRGAEIHLVLRTHGPAGVAGPVADQIGTASEACPMSGCVNEFASFHPPRG